MKNIGFLILSVPVTGIAAGVMGIFGPQKAGAALVLLGASILLIALLLRRPGDREEKKIEPARIISAFVVKAPYLAGEMIVEADHPDKVSRLLLPGGSTIKTVKRNQLYAVRFGIPPRRNPLSYTYEVARENGYRAGG